jgi:hypothetical protein
MKAGPKNGFLLDVYAFEDCSRSDGANVKTKCPKCNSITKTTISRRAIKGKLLLKPAHGADIHRWHSCSCGYKFRTIDFFERHNSFDATRAIPINWATAREGGRADKNAEKILFALAFADAMK